MSVACLGTWADVAGDTHLAMTSRGVWASQSSTMKVVLGGSAERLFLRELFHSPDLVKVRVVKGEEILVGILEALDGMGNACKQLAAGRMYGRPGAAIPLGKYQ